MRLYSATLLALLLAAAANAQPAQVNRIIRTFDFDERRLGNPEDLPMHWTKREGPGMPHYVNGRLSTDRARSGRYSFRFDLNGGSLIYRYGPGLIPIQPGAHYRVEGFVQTTAMPHARARISAYLADIDHRPIETTRRHSELYAARPDHHRDDAPWHRLSIELSADHPDARYLVIELGLLQPEQYADNLLGERALHAQDIHGTAWFDDITISQVPKVTLSTDRPANIFARSEPLKLQAIVNDRFTDDLHAQLTLRDPAGHLAHQHTGPLDLSAAQQLGPQQKRISLPLPDLDPGWYQATLILTSQGQLVGRQSLNLIRLPDDRPAVPVDPRFGLIATDLPFGAWTDLPPILAHIGAGRIKLAVWSTHDNVQDVGSTVFDDLLDRLKRRGITPTACLIDLPPQLRRAVARPQSELSHLGLNADPPRPPGWTDLLHADPELWQPMLAHLIARHANHLDRWQLGADGDERFVLDPAMRQVYRLIHHEFEKLITTPDLAIPWPAWHELPARSTSTNTPTPHQAAIALAIPSSVLPAQIPLYIQDVPTNSAHRLSITLEPIDPALYGRDTQIRDYAQRIIYALAAGADRIDLPLPLDSLQHDNHHTHQPQELLLIARTLITTLSGAEFRGKVPIADGVEAFLFERNGTGILALWSRNNHPNQQPLAINLGPRPLKVDLWGNTTPLLTAQQPTTNSQPPTTNYQLATSNQQLATTPLNITPTPIFLIGVDPNLARLRASLAFDRPLIESTFRPHTRKLRFTNPYPNAIGGTLRLRPPAGWSLNPPALTFTLNPGETFERDITIEFPYNSFAGPRTIDAHFTLQGQLDQSFTVPLTLTLGLSDVGMRTIAIRDGDDIIVQQTISNYSDHPIDYSAFAIIPNHARQERLVTNLAPGHTTVRLYRFPTIPPTPHTTVRTGLRELTGTRILNDEVPVQ
jgi:hypothetical protein